MGIPDPRHSRALLVGVSAYPKMPDDRQLPTVRAGLRKLAGLLRDERIWGLPEENCIVLDQPDDSDAVVTALREAAMGARDALVFYYAGHGLIDPALAGEELHLALPQAYEPGGTHLALSYAHIRREFNVNGCKKRRVVILDCCWSGLALGITMGSDDLVGAAAIEGTAVLTATAATRKALAPADEQYTAFTGALIDTLRLGVEDAPELLDIGTIYRHLKTVQTGRGRPLPQFGGSGLGSQMTLTRNLAWSPRDRTAPDRGSVPSGTADRIRVLRRLGRYTEADRLQQQAVEFAEPAAIRNLARELQRSSSYDKAERLEQLKLS